MSCLNERLRVLLADDVAGFTSIFSEWLKSADADVDVATNGLDAANRLQAIPYDLAILDVHMADLDGPNVVRLAKSSGMPMPRFFAITGDARTETRQACLDAGFIDVLEKPLLRSSFMELLEIEKLRRGVFD